SGALSVKDLAPLSGGRILLIVSRSPGAGKPKGGRRPAHEGLALVLDASFPPKAVRQIAFPGDGYSVSLTPDRRRAFILAQQAGQSEDQTGTRSWVHEIDPESGGLLGSATVAGPAFGLSIDPQGRRLFVSRQDRILSCTTAPLVNSWHYRSPG